MRTALLASVFFVVLLPACQKKIPSMPSFEMQLEHYDQGKRFLTLEGEVIMVDEGAYHHDVGVHIQDRWTQLLYSLDRQVKVPKSEYKMLAAVTVSNGGDVLDVHIKESSGSNKLDDLLLRAITESTPVPAPPPELVAEGETFTFDLRWEIVNKTPVQ